MEQVLKCFDCDYRGNSKTFEETEDNKHKCPKCKSAELDNTDKKLHISDVMCRYISDEIKRHDYYINSLYRSKIKGDLTEEEYQSKLEYERNEVILIIKGVLEGEFDWAKQMLIEELSSHFAKPVLYAGLAWKHHISEHFENGNCPTHPNGAGKGATIFTDYDKMVDYLKKDGRRWHAAELNLQNEPLIFEFGNNYMATIQRDCLSEQGFKPCI